MSKVIQQTAQTQRSQVSNLKRSHATEMRAIEESFQQRKADLKSNNEAAIIDLQNENHKQVDGEQQKKEKVLTEMKKNLNLTQQRTDRELAALKTTSAKSTDDLRSKTSTDRERIHQEHEAHLEEINDRFNDKSKDIRYEGQKRLADMDYSEKEKFSTLKDSHSTRLTGQTHDFNRKFTTDEQKYLEFKNLQDNGFKKERATVNQRQQKDLAKLGQEHMTHLEQKDKNFRKGVKEQDVQFEKQWQANKVVHESNFKNLDDLHSKVVTKVKTDLSSQVSQIVKRSDDKFYQFTELNPELTLHPDHVEIKVKVPDHSKQDLQLTTNNKEVIIVFNRRYQDTNNNQLGSAKVHRIESFTSRLNVDGILDPRSVKSTYDNGTMTYTIKKA